MSKSTKIISAAVAFATVVGVAAATSTPAAAGGKAKFYFDFYGPYQPTYYDPYYDPYFAGPVICKTKWKTRWSNRRGRYITYPKQVCFHPRPGRVIRKRR